MSEAFGLAIDVNSVRSAAQWRALLESLTASLSRRLQHEIVIVALHADDDQPGHASWGASADIRITLSRLPLLEASGTIAVTVNAGEVAMISADLLLFADGARIRGPAGADLFHLAFAADQGWSPVGWQLDHTGEWGAASTLPPHSPSAK